MASYSGQVKQLKIKSATLFIQIFAVLFVMISLNSELAIAQDKRTASLIHQPIPVEALPFPGSAMTLSVTMLNSRDSQLTVRGYIVRDGKLMSLPLSDYSVDDLDRIVYSATINAPLAELNYYFVLLGPNGVVSTSERYSLRRPCLPAVDTIDLKIPANTPAKTRLKLLQQQATGLQDELQNYETTVKLLEELKILTEK